MSSVGNEFELPLDESSEKYPVGIVTCAFQRDQGEKCLAVFI